MVILILSVVKKWAMWRENLSSGFPTRSGTNQAEQPQKMVRSLKFWILEVEEFTIYVEETNNPIMNLSYTM